MILATILSTLALGVVPGPWITQKRTYRAEVHEAREGDDPEVHGVDIKRSSDRAGGGAGSDTLVGEREIK